MTRDSNTDADKSDSFPLTIECGPSQDRHTHEVTIRHGKGRVYGAGRPENVRLQYTCPVSGETKIMKFRPPPGAARPFEVVELS